MLQDRSTFTMADQ